jgi:hypothetical protein
MTPLNPSVSYRLLVPLIAVLAALLLFAACGGDDEDEAPDGGAATPEARETPPADDDEEEPPTEAPDADDNGDADGTPSGEGVNVCELLPADEMSDILGEPVEAAESSVEPFFSCQYEGEEFAGALVTVYQAGSEDEAEAYVSIGRENSEDVEGLGDDAYWLGAPANSLAVREGSTVLEVAVYNLDEADEREAAVAIAETLLERLP